MDKQTFVLFAIFGLALCRPDGPPSYGVKPIPQPQPASYDFDWAVKDDYSNNDFGHQEARNGYDTQGSYHVLLPDGRRQTVTYTVNGDSGFIADVSYDGDARYPQQQQRPSYQPPKKPVYGQ